MKEKCNKFESLYTFTNNNELEEHIKTCPECKAEAEKMEKVSSLIQEAKPYYIQKRKNSYNRMQCACILGFGLLIGVMLGHFSQNLIPMTTNTYASNYDSSATTYSVNDYGMPVDSYGLITVN